MNKNAYEIRLDVLLDAHRFCTEIFHARVAALGASATKADVDKIIPTKKEILETAELFYEFISNNHNK